MSVEGQPQAGSITFLKLILMVFKPVKLATDEPILEGKPEAQRRDITGPLYGSVDPDRTPTFCCSYLEAARCVLSM